MGMAASAASIIAMAGDTIEIGAASFLMIHNCSVVAAKSPRFCGGCRLSGSFRHCDV
jgi:hypothetical protein